MGYVKPDGYVDCVGCGEVAFVTFCADGVNSAHMSITVTLIPFLQRTLTRESFGPGRRPVKQ